MTFPYDRHSTAFPDLCAHGMAWSLPCASCGRPYQPAPVYEVGPAPELHRKLDRIIELLERLAGDTDRAGGRG